MGFKSISAFRYGEYLPVDVIYASCLKIHLIENRNNIKLWYSKEIRCGYDIFDEERNVLYRILRRP